MLLVDQKIPGGRGYNGCLIVDGSIKLGYSNKKAKQLRAYHEQVNGRSKKFRFLNQKWSDDLNQHSTCFLAAAKVVQLCIENERQYINK